MKHAFIGTWVGLLFVAACHHFAPDMKWWAWLVLPAFFTLATPALFKPSY